MADEKKEASGIAAEAGMTSHEAEANEAIEWWHPATMLLSSTCTNCKAKLEPQAGTAAGDGGANPTPSSKSVEAAARVPAPAATGRSTAVLR